MTNFCINRKLIFFWDKYHIENYVLGMEFCEANMKILDYTIDKSEKISFIKDIRVSSNPYIIAIIVN